LDLPEEEIIDAGHLTTERHEGRVLVE
jgi:hypothetical protein